MLRFGLFAVGICELADKVSDIAPLLPGFSYVGSY
jgi:hypothetical protein